MVKVETLRIGEDASPARFHLKLKESVAGIRTQDWPRQLHGDLAWEPSQLADEDEYVLSLTEAELSEIRDALAYFNSKSPWHYLWALV